MRVDCLSKGLDKENLMKLLHFTSLLFSLI
jgi:hypothetical protein